ncbi:MAG: nitroreductase family protein [Bacteroidota bacterium]|nr:nitroreductase family protein [Bacteroidota bacterium]
MNKTILLALFLMTGMSAMAQSTTPLPQPDKSVSTTLFTALQNRHSVRNFTDRTIDTATLSQLLWAATGVNRPDGHMTAPTAVNAQDISVYVATKDGASLYLPKEHALKLITTKDIRNDVAGRQTGVANAPVFLIVVSDASKFRNSGDGKMNPMCYLDGGYVSQNICLGATALGLGTVPRGTINQEPVRTALQLTQSQIIVINHPVGYPKD